ncbi:uncharacterized protein [Lepeophtheirus salmonis]|uniref:uncharacterized protein n=1 Tax=Lepeophtheirus salmonis TaxID=72036 RepID=UPI001AE85A21|nr:GATA zinc finger domain-containing protein 14-like [Lepeophtheirus salmonis]
MDTSKEKNPHALPLFLDKTYNVSQVAENANSILGPDATTKKRTSLYFIESAIRSKSKEEYQHPISLEDVTLTQDHYDTNGARIIRTVSSNLMKRINSLECIGIHELALDLLETNRHDQNILIHNLRKLISNKNVPGLTTLADKTLAPSPNLKLPSKQTIEETITRNQQRQSQQSDLKDHSSINVQKRIQTSRQEDIVIEDDGDAQQGSNANNQNISNRQNNDVSVHSDAVPNNRQERPSHNVRTPNKAPTQQPTSNFNSHNRRIHERNQKEFINNNNNVAQRNQQLHQRQNIAEQKSISSRQHQNENVNRNFNAQSQQNSKSSTKNQQNQNKSIRLKNPFNANGQHNSQNSNNQAKQINVSEQNTPQEPIPNNDQRPDNVQSGKTPRKIESNSNFERNRRENGERRKPNTNSPTSIENFLQRFPEVRRISSRFHNEVPQRVLNDHSQRTTKPSATARTTKPSATARTTTPRVNRLPTTKRILREPFTKRVNRVPPTTKANRPLESNARRENKASPTTEANQNFESNTRRENKASPATEANQNFESNTRGKNRALPATKAKINLPTTPRGNRGTPASKRFHSAQTTTTANIVPLPESPDFENEEEELSSVDYSYLYSQDYYDELVPPHHRFQQLNKNNFQRKQVQNVNNNNFHRQQQESFRRQHANNQQKSTNFNKVLETQAQSEHSKNRKSNQKHTNPILNNLNKENQNHQNIKNQQQISNSGGEKKRQHSLPLTNIPKTPNSLKKTKQDQTTPRNVATDNTKKNAGQDTISVGPFGYTDKGEFFSDDTVTGFPQIIDLTYQGFVWAITLQYPEKEKKIHGGIHSILKDKVKQKKINMRDDYIIRVTGRASPYNINRLTLYTSKGKVYGPFGERQHKESVDFDESAPEGHALAYFSGTINLGVPLRSVGFHWRPIPS